MQVRDVTVGQTSGAFFFFILLILVFSQSLESVRSGEMVVGVKTGRVPGSSTLLSTTRLVEL